MKPLPSNRTGAVPSASTSSSEEDDLAPKLVRFHPKPETERGFTLIELLAVLAIVGTLASIAVPEILSAIENARYATAMGDLNTYTKKILRHRTRSGKLPTDWEDLGYTNPPTDPWGNKYVYFNHNDISPGKRRKDGPTVPINSHFDLFSPGPNGDYSATIQAKTSKDDVIVAEDGQYIGRAEDY